MNSQRYTGEFCPHGIGGAPSSWYLGMFASLEALRIPYFGDFYGIIT